MISALIPNLQSVLNTALHSFVWLVPTFTSDPGSAQTSYSIVIQGDSNDHYQDLAKGAGGDYRYLHSRHDGEQKITKVNLLRLDEALGDLPAGYDGRSGDINQGRGGTYLYLIWKSVRV